MKVHVCEPENHNKRCGKAAGESEERGGDGEVVEGERTGKTESVRTNNDLQGLLGSDNLLTKGVASGKEEGSEERTPPRHEKREYSVLYENEENLKKSDSGR